jgi:hypothetical protein
MIHVGCTTGTYKEKPRPKPGLRLMCYEWHEMYYFSLAPTIHHTG